MDIMNRETSIHSSDTLVVVDRSRRSRQLIIAAAVGILLLLVTLFFVFGRGGSDKAAKDAAANAGQVPSVTVVVPGQSSVGRVITGSGPLSAKRDQPIGIAGSGGRVERVLVDAGSWVRAGQVLATVDRSVQAQQANQLAAQVEAARANAALAQSNYQRAIALQGRGFVSMA
jgi:multidrug efflux pump subunit AcrA (membrane-fusion protein)